VFIKFPYFLPYTQIFNRLRAVFFCSEKQKKFLISPLTKRYSIVLFGTVLYTNFQPLTSGFFLLRKAKKVPYFPSHKTILNRFVRHSPIHKFSTAYERFFFAQKSKKSSLFPLSQNDTQSFCSAQSYTQIFNRHWRFFFVEFFLVPQCHSILIKRPNCLIFKKIPLFSIAHAK